MRSTVAILPVSFALALASGYGTEALGQSESKAECWLEQRLAPSRAACHTPLHFVTAVRAAPDTPETGLTRAATLSVFGRSRFASDRDNGAVWAGKGLSLQFATGIGGTLGPLRFGIFPAVHWAQNLDFVVADTAVAGYSSYVYPWEGPGIDWPQRMGSATSRALSPGQSFFELAGWSQTAVGVSSENIWWGPSKRYPMLLGATSDGFPHVYVRSPTVAVGPFRTLVRAVIGRLTESEYFDQADDNDRNLLAALRLEIGLSVLPGAQVAVTSMVRQRWDSGVLLKDVIRLDPRSSGPMDDAIGAVTFLLPVASLGLRLHGTWGRGDSVLDTEDFLTEPDHNQFWAIGLHQEWRLTDDGPTWSLSMEHASSVASASQLGAYRSPGSLTVYRHSGNRQGYTQRGQLLGPSIGPGTRATYVSFERASDRRYLGVLVEQILWDIDAFRRSVPNKSRDGQDREWLFAGRLGTDLPVPGVDNLRLDAFGGVSLRWNRQYIRFTGDLLDHPERETNFWLDLRLAWTPDRENDGR